jgi:hypothetical protein
MTGPIERAAQVLAPSEEEQAEVERLKMIVHAILEVADKTGELDVKSLATPHCLRFLPISFVQPGWGPVVMSAVFAVSATSPVYLRLRKGCGSAAK